LIIFPSHFGFKEPVYHKEAHQILYNKAIKMKKIFVIHGFDGSPNGGWRPWIMGELAREETYCGALLMPSPENPKCEEWIHEIERYTKSNAGDQFYLIGHSLGVPAILRFLEGVGGKSISGAVLVSGPIHKTENKKLDSFFEKPFDYQKIRSRCKNFVVIHGDNDPMVSLEEGKELGEALNAKLIVVPNGGHLNGASGWQKLPQVLDALVYLEAIETNNEKEIKW